MAPFILLAGLCDCLLVHPSVYLSVSLLVRSSIEVYYLQLRVVVTVWFSLLLFLSFIVNHCYLYML